MPLLTMDSRRLEFATCHYVDNFIYRRWDKAERIVGAHLRVIPP